MSNGQKMEPPYGAIIWEGELADFWFDNEGILYAKSKTANRTLEAQVRNNEFIRKIAGGKKICLLADASKSSPQDKATRDYVAKEMPELYRAMAVLSATPVGQTITRIFTTLQHEPIPIRTFNSIEEAKAWLRQFLS